MPCRRTDRLSRRVCHRGLRVAGHRPCGGHNNNQGLCGHHHNLPVGNHRTLQVFSHQDPSAAEVETWGDDRHNHCDEGASEIARGDRMADHPCSNVLLYIGRHFEDVPHDDPRACSYQVHRAERRGKAQSKITSLSNVRHRRRQREQVYRAGLYRPNL
jgi:hypothetical protein